MTEPPSQQFWCAHAVVGGQVGGHVSDGVLVTVADGRFTTVELGVPAPAGARRLNGLTVPGMANAHSHAFHRALRSHTQAEQGTFWTWRNIMYRAAERLNPDNYHRLARAVFGEMVLAGITAVGEFHYVHHGPDGTPYNNPNAMGSAVLAAAREAGIRINLLDTLYLYGGLGDGRGANSGYTAPEGVQRRYSDGNAEAWVDRVDGLASASDLTDGQVLGCAVHSVRAVDSEAMATVAAWAEATNSVVHAHVSEQVAENEACSAVLGRTPVQVLADAGILGPRFCAVHATHLTDGDIALLGSTDSGVCFCPTTERDLGDGIGPAPELRTAGVELSLGSDSHAVIDHFEEARALELNERLRSEQRGLFKAPDLLAMATNVGHRHLGWSDAGRIEVGARADLVEIDLNSVRTAGSSPELGIEAAVFAATTADVRTVVVDGVEVVVDGRHRSLDVAAELTASISAVLS